MLATIAGRPGAYCSRCFGFREPLGKFQTKFRKRLKCKTSRSGFVRQYELSASQESARLPFAPAILKATASRPMRSKGPAILRIQRARHFRLVPAESGVRDLHRERDAEPSLLRD